MPIKTLIEETLGFKVVLFALMACEPIDRDASFRDVADDFRRRNPAAPQYAPRTSSGAFRISDLPAAPPAM